MWTYHRIILHWEQHETLVGLPSVHKEYRLPAAIVLSSCLVCASSLETEVSKDSSSASKLNRGGKSITQSR